MTWKWYSKDQDLEETVFVAAMYWRIIYGAIRIFIGYKLLSFVGHPIFDAYQHFLRRELSETHDVLFQGIGNILSHQTFFITYFLAGYLLFWGVMDIVLSVSMLRHYLWAFTVSMGVMALFIGYELYRISHTHSHTLFGFILIDIFIVYLIYDERRKLIARRERKLQEKRTNGDNAGNGHDTSGHPSNALY